MLRGGSFLSTKIPNQTLKYNQRTEEETSPNLQQYICDHPNRVLHLIAFNMKLPELVAAFFLFPALHLMLTGSAAATQVTLYVQNKCPFPIWPATAPNAGNPVIADGGFYLPSGQTQRIYAPLTWSGRIWARTGCKFNSNWNPTCETGDCDGRLACNGLIGTPPVTLVQVALQEDQSKPSFYDVSLVDGYNIPVAVTTRQTSQKCIIGGCLKNVNKLCPHELEVLNINGEVVACKSACLAFGVDKFCCTNEFGTPEKCKPTVYSKIFKDACPSYYSYAFDTPPPLVNCASREYVITFCPSGWGDADTSI